MKNIDFIALLVRAKGALGDCIEVGVHNGHSALKWAHVYSGKKFYAFDTFAGMPVSKLGEDEEHLKNIGAGYLESKEVIFNRLKGAGIIPVQGIFPDDVREKIPELISFAHLDADNYLTTAQALVIIDERLSADGVIIVHDYNNEYAPGIKRSVDEFVANKPWYSKIESHPREYVAVYR